MNDTLVENEVNESLESSYVNASVERNSLLDW